MFALLAAWACTGSPDPTAAVGAERPLTLLAASSLTESLGEVAAAWAAQGHPAPLLSFESSAKLAKQIEAGVPADLFFSADAGWMDTLAQGQHLDAATRVDLLGNRLVAVVPQDSPLALHSPADLSLPALTRLALAGEAVPAGRYARAALVHAGVYEAVQARVIPGDNVRAVLSWVAAGEADAGVVYATDARVEPRVKLAFVFPADSHPPIVYPAAVLRGSGDPAQARAFLEFCQSPSGQAVFERAGFEVRAP